MGWLTNTVNAVVNYATGGTSGLSSEFVNAAVGLGGDLIGSQIAGNANQKAAKTVASGYQAQAGAIQAGNDAAQARFNTIIEQGQPATDYLRRVVASDPYQLTPEQLAGRESVARDANNSLAASGLRGAGRSGVAVINGANNAFYDRAVTSNINRADNAANALSARATNAGMAGAQADLNTGTRLSSGQPQAADVKAGADVANAALTGSVMGSLSSFIAGDEKSKERESRYKTWKNPDV